MVAAPGVARSVMLSSCWPAVAWPANPYALAQRDTGLDAGAGAWGAGQIERAAQPLDPLAHRAQAEVAGEALPRVEAAPIIADDERQRAILNVQRQLQRVGAGVLDGVVQRLLGDAVERFLDLQRRVRLIGQRGRHRDAMPRA